MRLVILVDFNTHFGPHVQVIVNLMLSQRLVYFRTLLVDFAIIDVFTLIFGG